MISLSRFLTPVDDGIESDEARYEWQMNIRANYLLVGDKNVQLPVDIDGGLKSLKSDIKWINKGELIAGSFLCNIVKSRHAIGASDIDIYFKSREDAQEFCRNNPQLKYTQAYTRMSNAFVMDDGSDLYNLIFCVAYDSPQDLISHFDIRAASIAYDPVLDVIYSVRGALADCAIQRIVYNPVPHNTTIARLVKYTQKGFGIDPYQRLFLTEFIKSDQYKPELEISTGYRATQK